MAGHGGYRVTEVVVTPNPNARKFVVDRPLTDQPLSFFSAESAAGHPVAAKLFSIQGVTNLLFLGDFVTVSKRPEVDWKPLVTKVRKLLESLKSS